MQLIVYVDPQGLVQIDLVTAPEEREIAHAFWESVRPLAEEFGAAVQSLSFDQGSSTLENSKRKPNIQDIK